ncbi:Cyclin-related protein FAM58A [Orchesella cincta]|uniref:Cyclin-Q n=1 Tax=Orchesella cincta TaxID=48709 RepID=A0A1D2N4L0_ORCCI|nr:Cyclin-related protein FAM58A [Orchesella cincta]
MEMSLVTHQGMNRDDRDRRLQMLSQESLESDDKYKLVDYRRQQSLFLGARFIFECGLKLEATPIAVATAACLFHRFFKEVETKNYDVYQIGGTCLYLAGKVENQHLRIRDIINVCYTSIHRNTPPLELGEAYFAFRDAIFQAELLMMRILKFKIAREHPHKFLTHYLKSIEEWVGHEACYKNPLPRTSWAVLQDFHMDPAVTEYPPEALAVAAIQIALQVYGAQVPLCSEQGRNSWQMIVYPGVQPDIQSEIMLKMLRVYDLENELLARFPYKESVNGK